MGKGLVILFQLVIVLQCNDAASHSEDVDTSNPAINYLQLASSGCFCCPAISSAISHCQFHSSTVKWYRCSGVLADSCHLSVPSRAADEQLASSAWVNEVGKICFSNFTLEAVSTYCCALQSSNEQCVTMSVKLSGEIDSYIV